MSASFLQKGSKAVILGLLALFVFTFTALPAMAAQSDSTDTDVTFTAGELTLNSAPDIHFGSHGITAGQESYPSNDESLSPIEVADLTGSNSGWSLNVALTSFHLSGDDAEAGPFTLAGAYITMQDLDIEPVNGTVGEAPSTFAAKDVISGDDEVKLISASAGKGGGVWSATMDPAKTTLTVLPGTAKKGANVANLNWSLVNAP